MATDERTRPSLNSRGLWAIREAKCLATIAHALKQLRDTPDLAESEVELNRHFYFCLLEVSRELYPRMKLLPSPSAITNLIRTTRRARSAN